MAMIQANRLKKVLDSGDKAWGHWQTIAGTNISRALANSGVDWVLVDCEHGNIADAAMHESVGAIAATGVSPIVRIPDNQGWLVKRALDCGAHGVLVPLLNTVGDAERLVSSAKFPPQGVRGFGSPFSQGAFSATMTAGEYLVQANSALLTIVQIETAEALKNVDGIAAVPGVDVLFVGPFDLGNALGHPITGPTMHPELEAAIAKVLAAAQRAGKKSGIYTPNGEQAKKMAGLGFDMVNVTADSIALAMFLGSEVAKAKGAVSAEEMTGPYGK
ncbi:hypothetical protein V493_03324 [Pseudogymnoascus sp. VKM F-4281 (FW-2241)]|nr:hypothetical protein V493_03324 [Pseudogymnoascus sp. VKM F-4281 (FW-2241)]